jgi:AcrR family transcriptional regulator
MSSVKGVKSRREQYSEATRAAILDAALRRFAERGYAGTALEDVAADIQVTRGAVYHHFTSKKALFEAVYEKMETEAVGQVAAAAARESDPWLAAQVSLEVFLDHCCDPVYGRVVWQEGPLALGWTLWKECEERHAYGVIQMLLRALIDGGYIEPVPLETLAHITFAILGEAGATLAETPEADKQRVRSEYSTVIQRLLVGMRPATP